MHLQGVGNGLVLQLLLQEPELPALIPGIAIGHHLQTHPYINNWENEGKGRGRGGGVTPTMVGRVFHQLSEA